ncbi:MAG: hypothetical protein ACON3Z_17735 [Bradymonadia bacterium]
MLAFFLTLRCLLLVPVGAVDAQQFTVSTHYDDDRDVFVTTGQLKLPVSLERVTRFAAEFGQYRDWALKGINQKASGRSFIVQLRDLSYVAGKPSRHGHFIVKFDVDLVWPFKERDSQIKFKLDRLRRHGQDGVDMMALSLYGESRFIRAFDLVLSAMPQANGSAVSFRSEVELSPVVDTFFPLSVYRRNIEYRIAKVILNIHRHLVTDGTKSQ